MKETYEYRISLLKGMVVNIGGFPLLIEENTSALTNTPPEIIFANILGARGGKARAARLSPQRRKEIATKASHARKPKTK